MLLRVLALIVAPVVVSSLVELALLGCVVVVSLLGIVCVFLVVALGSFLCSKRLFSVWWESVASNGNRHIKPSKHTFITLLATSKSYMTYMSCLPISDKLKGMYFYKCNT